MGSINLGPLAFPFAPLLLLCTMLIATTVGRLVGRAQGVGVEWQIWKSLIFGAIVARIVFVAGHMNSYRDSPWNLFDIRDGGFFASAGVLAGMALTGWQMWRAPEKRKPLGLAALAGAVVWVLGLVGAVLFYSGSAEMSQVTLARLDGTPVELKSLAGKPLVVNLWATWCPPCRREMPVLRDAQAHERDVMFVFANQGESADAIRSYLEAEHLAIENVLLDWRGQLATASGSRALPTTLFIDANGRIVDRWIGALSSGVLKERLQNLLGARQVRPLRE